MPDEERIIGGQPADPNSIPWQVGVLKKEAPNSAWCGGTIITSTYVMTAAHCKFEQNGDELFENDFVVLAGEHDLLNDIDAATSHDVEKINNHPQYSNGGFDYDYSIFELTNPIELTGSSKARAACLPDPGDTSFEAGTNFVVSGWGARDDGSIGGELHHVTVPFVSDTVCSQAYGGGITTRMICAGDIQNGGVDSCGGDSGGNA